MSTASIYMKKGRKLYDTKLSMSDRNSVITSTDPFSVYSTSKSWTKISKKYSRKTYFRKPKGHKGAPGSVKGDNLISTAAGKLREKIAHHKEKEFLSNVEISMPSAQKSMNIYNSFNSNRQSNYSMEVQSRNLRQSTISNKSVNKTPKRDYYTKIYKKFGNRSSDKPEKKQKQKNSLKLCSRSKIAQSSHNILEGSGLIRDKWDIPSGKENSPYFVRADSNPVNFSIKIIETENDNVENKTDDPIQKFGEDSSKRILEESCWYTEKFNDTSVNKNNKESPKERLKVSNKGKSSWDYYSVKRSRVAPVHGSRVDAEIYSGSLKENIDPILVKPNVKISHNYREVDNSRQNAISEKRKLAKRPKTRRKIKIIGIRCSNK